MKYTVKNTFVSFFLPCLVFLAAGLYVIIAFTQKDIFFYVNMHNSTILDTMMPYFTDIGNGVFCIVLCLIALFFINIRFGLAMASSYALEGILVQILKQLVFTNRPRPWAEYADKFPIHLVPDFTPYSNNSFPSGHTATAFCMATLIVMAYPKMKKAGHLLLFLVALTVGYSRIYLSQHYFLDVYAGSVLGIFSSAFIYYIFYSHRFKSGKQKLWLDKTLITLKR